MNITKHALATRRSIFNYDRNRARRLDTSQPFHISYSAQSPKTQPTATAKPALIRDPLGPQTAPRSERHRWRSDGALHLRPATTSRGAWPSGDACGRSPWQRAAHTQPVNTRGAGACSWCSCGGEVRTYHTARGTRPGDTRAAGPGRRLCRRAPGPPVRRWGKLAGPPAAGRPSTRRMSGRRAAEKLSEIDAHVTKHYDVLRRLGKGVSCLMFRGRRTARMLLLLSRRRAVRIVIVSRLSPSDAFWAKTAVPRDEGRFTVSWKWLRGNFCGFPRHNSITDHSGTCTIHHPFV